jgi:hypothetical protein|tara:strand:+ start:160 stop:756 length:597 start_codon:yes stop_codon:yes gene_type:complete
MLSIKYKRTDQVIPYVNNSRTHGERQVQQIASSIQEFGFTNPILIDHDGGLIAGHGRLLAAQMLNLDKVPTITLGDLSDAQRKAYVIADNKLALNSGWDDELLKVEIEALSDSNFDLGVLGWDVLPDFKDDVDYSILDDDDIDADLSDMTDGVKRAIQIEFESQDYDEAAELIKFWRSEGAYVGGLILDYFRKEKAKL